MRYMNRYIWLTCNIITDFFSLQFYKDWCDECVMKKAAFYIHILFTCDHLFNMKFKLVHVSKLMSAGHIQTHL